MRGNLQIHGGMDWSWGSLALVMGRELPDGNIQVAKPLEFETTQRGLIKEPMVRLEKNEAQQLFDLLWQEGYRPKDGTGNGGHIEAIKYHLEDMRKLALKSTEP